MEKVREFMCDFCGNTFESTGTRSNCCKSKECLRLRDLMYYERHYLSNRTSKNKKAEIDRELKEINGKEKKVYRCLKCLRPIRNNPDGCRLHEKCRKQNEKYDAMAMGVCW